MDDYEKDFEKFDKIKRLIEQNINIECYHCGKSLNTYFCAIQHEDIGNRECPFCHGKKAFHFQTLISMITRIINDQEKSKESYCVKGIRDIEL